jgi:phosphoglycerol transferase MdoB-like AlkP superfamily enzyme
MGAAAIIAFLVCLSFQVQILSAPYDDSFFWSFRQYLERVWPALTGLLLTSSLYALVLALTNSQLLAILLPGLLLVLAAIANCVKLSTLGSPLLPIDVLLIRDATRVFDTGYLAAPGGKKLAILVAGVLCLIVLASCLPRPRLRWPVRAAVVVTVALFLSTLFTRQWNYTRCCSAAFPEMPWSSPLAYRTNGFLGFMAMHCPYAWVERPSDYSSEAVARLCADVGGQANAVVAARPPNLVIVLSESFWDPTGIPGVEFTPDPVPTFHELQKQNGQIELISPVFGGMTCNAAFEVLSGLNMAFLPDGANAASINYIRRPIPALPAVLRGHGYETLMLEAMGGIHNPQQVQPLLGFQSYVPGEQWKNQSRTGGVISDLVVAEEVVEWSTKLTRPYFICVATMEGHGPYRKGKYAIDSMSTRVSGPNVRDDETSTTLQTYAEGLRRADGSLRYIIDHLSLSSDPVLVVFFGDHQPALGSGYSIYKRIGYWDGSEVTKMAKLHQTQVVIWSNYGAVFKPSRQLFSMCYLPGTILELLNVPPPVHMQFLNSIRDRWPVISVAGCVSEGGRQIPWSEAEVAPDLRAYKLLQYDIMFGDQYSMKPRNPAETNWLPPK